MRIIRLIENQSVRNIVRFLTFLKPYWRKGVHAGFWMTLSVLLRLPLPLLTMYIIDHVLVAKNLSMLNWICLGLILVLLFQIIASLLHRYLLLVFKERVIFDIQLKLFQHIERLSFKFFQSKQTGYLMSRIQNDTNAVHGLLADTVLNFCRDVLTFIVGLTIIFVIHWKLALASIAVLPCFVISLTAFIRKLRNLSKQVQESYAVVAQNLQQSLSGIYLVKSFVRQKFQARKLLCSLKSLIKINIKRGMMGSLLGNLTTLIGSAGPLAVLWYGGSEIIRGNLTIGQLIAFNAFLPYLFGPTQRLVNLNFSVQQSLGAIERIFEMMDLEPEVKEIDGAKKLPKIEGYVQFDNVSFSYDEVKNVLENINLSAEPGQIVAVVGYSGAGKSTLVNLIPRFYDPVSRSVLIDGHDIRRVKLQSLRKQIGVVAQDTFLFNGSVKENIRYGRTNATDEEIIEAAKAANAHEFIMGLTDGYETQIGERGVKLSGGEKQRLSIARTILKNPRMLILDEATSQVDSESENLIQEAFSILLKNRTTLVIAHRLSTVQRADKIIVVNDGKIVEQGTHEELYKRGGLYRKLYDGQFRDG